jgi:uncharacterized protein YqgV (UPF0045/DUF77 family)
MFMQRPEAGLAIQVLPKTANDDAMIAIVDKVIAYIKSTGLKTFVGPFETTVEGDFEKLMQIAAESQRICMREGAESVSSYMKLFYNPRDGVLSTEEKVTKHHEKK